MLNAIKPSKKTVMLYLLVPVVMFIFTVFVPLVTALVYSFFEWKGGPQKTFIGIENYTQLFHDTTFWKLSVTISILSSPVSSARSALPLYWF